uniref:Uncharacterized protein n=1 Tax=Leersia perrieri TaxID=77586 RepID=A0A0D9WFT8_9ORYZ
MVAMTLKVVDASSVTVGTCPASAGNAR